jgi:hypothetical protein
MFLVMYAKVNDLKKKGLTMDGPFFGSECETMDLAHEECRKLVTNNKEHVLVKTFDMSKTSDLDAKKEALLYFTRIFNDMQIAQELCDAPKRRRRK